MARFIYYLIRLLILVKFTYTVKYSKVFTKEIGFYDIGPAVFYSTESPSTIYCVSLCVNQEGCLAAVYHNGSKMCFFLDSTDTLVETNDVDYSFILVGEDNDTYHCTDGWIGFGASCYLIGGDLLKWSEALDFCETENAILVEIETESENVFLQNTLSEMANLFVWIGLNDLDVEGVWMWASGATANYTDWGLLEPNGLSVSNCGGIFASYGYKWVDEPCYHLFYPLCEKAATELP